MADSSINPYVLGAAVTPSNSATTPPAASSSSSSSGWDAYDPSATTLGLGAAGAAGLLLANRANAQNKALAGQVTSAGQTDINVGNTYLNAAEQGTLTPAEQAEQNALLDEHARHAGELAGDYYLALTNAAARAGAAA